MRRTIATITLALIALSASSASAQGTARPDVQLGGQCTSDVQCVAGAIFDVIVDVRPGSRTLGRWRGMELSEANRRLLVVPPTLEKEALELINAERSAAGATNIYRGSAELLVSPWLA